MHSTTRDNVPGYYTHWDTLDASSLQLDRRIPVYAERSTLEELEECLNDDHQDEHAHYAVQKCSPTRSGLDAN